jgi:hypothetical protein
MRSDAGSYIGRAETNCSDLIIVGWLMTRAELVGDGHQFLLVTQREGRVYGRQI